MLYHILIDMNIIYKILFIKYYHIIFYNKFIIKNKKNDLIIYRNK